MFPRSLCLGAAFVGVSITSGCASAPPPRGVELAKLTWLEAERVLRPETIIVIPLGAAAKEHGPHLTLENDFLLAEYFKQRVLETCDVVVAPTIPYHFYPAFTEYPGSTTLREDTARALVVDIVTSLAHFGPRRFYVLNTGVSTVRALAPAAEELARAGIVLRYTELDDMAPIEKAVCAQLRGSHADEVETSMMLVIAPDTVDMSKAVQDDNAKGEGGLTRERGNAKTYSPSGVWGDATLATRAKGERFVSAFTALVVRDLAELARVPLAPTGTAARRSDP